MNQFAYNQYYFQNGEYYFPDTYYDQYQFSVDDYNDYYQYQPQMYYPSPFPRMEAKKRKIKKQNMHNANTHHLTHNEILPYDQPVCIAIGDIEGNVHKLRLIVDFIKATDYNFVFIGDIFDDISDASPTKKQGFKCLKMIYDFLSPFKNESDFAFKNIKFDDKNFYDISNRVKFIAGNSECDVLKDIIETKELKKNSEGKYVFGKGKYQKTFSEKQLSILYRYFRNCCGVISLNPKHSSSRINDDFVDSVFFRHSPDIFDHSHKLIRQIPKKNYVNCYSSLLIVGHVHYFGPLLSTSENCQIFSIDTTYIQKNKSTHDIDNRVVLVTYNPITGFFVEPFYIQNV